jgi:hypothetical protein
MKAVLKSDVFVSRRLLGTQKSQSLARSPLQSQWCEELPGLGNSIIGRMRCRPWWLCCLMPGHCKVFMPIVLMLVYCMLGK